MEHNSVLRPLYACGQTGTEVTILGCDEKGNISYEKLESGYPGKYKSESSVPTDPI